MTVVDVREFERHTSDLVRRAESGEIITVRVSGRLTAQLGPLGPRCWRWWSEVADCYSGSPDPDWSKDRDLVDHATVDAYGDS